MIFVDQDDIERMLTRIIDVFDWAGFHVSALFEYSQWFHHHKYSTEKEIDKPHLRLYLSFGDHTADYRFEQFYWMDRFAKWLTQARRTVLLQEVVEVEVVETFLDREVA